MTFSQDMVEMLFSVGVGTPAICVTKLTFFN